jgi:hypothetical protein
MFVLQYIATHEAKFPLAFSGILTLALRTLASYKTLLRQRTMGRVVLIPSQSVS